MAIEDLIPKALLAQLEQEDKSLVHTKDGWITVPSSSLLMDGTLITINERLARIEEVVNQLTEDKKF